MEYRSIAQTAVTTQVLFVVASEASPNTVIWAQLHDTLFHQVANEVPDHEAGVSRF
jgi:hypothetical protein